MEGNRAGSTYKIYKESEKEQLFALVYERGMSARQAALQLQINPSTAQRWVANDQQNLQTYITRKECSGRPVVGRPALMNECHKTHLINLIDEEPALVLDQMMESLTASFSDLKVSKTAIYNFATNECKISLKRAHFYSVDRNSPEKIKARKEWVEKWMNTDMDYISNCVFIDEAAFYINMKRSVAWSKVGTRAFVNAPKIRAKTTTILGATSAFGVVNIKVRRPRVMPSSKKRKTTGSSGPARTQSISTVTGHYFNFLSDTMDEMDKHPNIFKDNYLIMDNTPIHMNDNIKLFIESRGYRCVYLPPYSPEELNPLSNSGLFVRASLKERSY